MNPLERDSTATSHCDLRVPSRRSCSLLRLSMTPGALLLQLLVAISTAVAEVTSDAPTTALSPATGDATLAFVFDVTGSMWDDLMQVIDGASRILERSLSSRSRVIANYALVPFHDPGSALAVLEVGPIPHPSCALASPVHLALCGERAGRA